MQTRFNRVFPLFVILFSFQLIFSQESTLSVEKIMQDPAWMGTFPSNIRWSEDSKIIYFNYNLQKDPADSLYKIYLNSRDNILKVSREEQKNLLPGSGSYSRDRSKKIFNKNGTLMLWEQRNNNTRQLIDLGEGISDPRFLWDENKVSFTMNSNLFVYNLSTGSLEKITNIRNGDNQDKSANSTTKEAWVREENLGLLKVVRQREEQKEKSDEYRKMADKEPFTFYAGKKSVSNLQLSPTGKYATFTLLTRAENNRTEVPNYVDPSGYTVNLPTRTKVGDDPTKVEMAVYHLEKDTVVFIKTDNLKGIKDLPDFITEYPDKTWEEKKREVILTGPYFSNNGKAIVNVRSHDNKDRWIALLDPETGDLKTLDRQRDEAWIAGPGIGHSFGGGTIGWLPDNSHIYFQSEESGYSHLYLMDVNSGKKKALTSGNFEVFEPFLSKDQKHWFFTSSETGPGERHFYKMPVMGGAKEKLTAMTGNNNVSLSPDEKQMAILYSYSNKPWELYVKNTSTNASAKQLTSGQSGEFSSYSWREPELVHFKAQDGARVPARLYKPTEEANNGAAVIFVHGAGYLQNVHKWWSSYFR